MPESFAAALWLPGWDDASIWGYDEQTGGYFAQLWRNTDNHRAPPPTVWIGGLDPVGTPRELAHWIAIKADVRLVHVLAAIGHRAQQR